MNYGKKLLLGISLCVGSLFFSAIIGIIYSSITNEEISDQAFYLIGFGFVALNFTRLDVNGFISDKKKKKDSSL
jgi:hypothetical protein